MGTECNRGLRPNSFYQDQQFLFPIIFNKYCENITNLLEGSKSTLKFPKENTKTQ